MSDLTSPLGVKPPQTARKERPYVAVAASMAALFALLLALWILLVDDPFGGEPMAVAVIEDFSGTPDRQDVTVVGVKSGAGEILPPPGSQSAAEEMAPEAPGGAQIREVKVSVQADPDLIEDSPQGPLPRISEDGVMPLEAYARPAPAGVVNTPRIALIVGGLGISQTGTQEALRLLPPDVTLAFAPYGASLDRWTAKARQNGHELLLQLPLEPYDYPDNDPGPHTLLTSLDTDRNSDRLHYLMSRFGAYVGAITYMGARFTAEGPALDPVLAEFTARGLMFVDEGTSNRSVAATVAKARGTAFAAGDVVIDAVPAEADIAGRLAQLEQLARTQGFAIGTASALPVTLKTVSAWASSLDSRGVTLVPITAALSSP